MASARWRIVLDQPSPAAWPGRHVRGSCSTRPLRQNYITPHCPQCPPVSRKLLLWQPPLRALRVKATGFMQNCLRWSGCTAVGAPRSLARPTRRRQCALVAIVAPGHQSGASRIVLVSGLRPVMLCVPRPPWGLAAARHWPCAGLPVRPQGAPSAQRKSVPSCRNRLGSGQHMQSRQAGLSARKPT